MGSEMCIRDRSDGTHTASIALLGNYSLANFTASSDGHGGTSVVDPPLTGGSVLYVAADPAGAQSGLNQQPLTGGSGLYIAADPAGSQSGLNQQMALFRQSLASFAPSEGGGDNPTSPVLPNDSGQLSGLAQPVANQQHA